MAHGVGEEEGEEGRAEFQRAVRGELRGLGGQLADLWAEAQGQRELLESLRAEVLSVVGGVSSEKPPLVAGHGSLSGRSRRSQEADEESQGSSESMGCSVTGIASFGYIRRNMRQRNSSVLDSLSRGVTPGGASAEPAALNMQEVILNSLSQSSCRSLERGRSTVSAMRMTRIGSFLGSLAQRLSENMWFEIVVGLIILVNAVFIGVELELDLQGEAHASFTWLEHMFLAIFVLELTIRFVADGRPILQSWWYRFDLLVVGLGVLKKWVVTPIIVSVASNRDLGFDLASQFSVLRALRLMRLAQMLRLFAHFGELWKICRGMVQAAQAGLSAFVLVSVSVYIFACVGVEVIMRSERLASDPETAAIVERHFRSLPVAMMTLLQFANQDSIASLYGPLVEREPWLSLYFLAVWMLVTVLLMNLVTALIVESAITQASEDREARFEMLRRDLQTLIPVIEEAFDSLDTSQVGRLSLEDVMNRLPYVQLPKEMPRTMRRMIQGERLLDIFSCLLDEEGTMSKREFVEVICQLACSEASVETMQMLHLLRHIQAKVHHLEALEFGVPTRPLSRFKSTGSQSRHSTLEQARSTDLVKADATVPSAGANSAEDAPVPTGAALSPSLEF